MQTLGLVFITVGTGGLTLIGLYAIASLSLSGRRESRAGIDPRKIVSIRESTSRSGAKRGQGPSRLVRHVPSVTDELFSELFALRAEMAALTEDVRSIRQQLEAGLAEDDYGPIEAGQTAA